MLAEEFWPGPLTLVLPRKANLNPMICAGLPTVGVRLPRHPLARRLIRRMGVPLAAPSANRFGKTSPTSAAHVRGEWPEDQVFVLEGDTADIGIESTVVRVVETADGHTVEILRPGFIGRSQILSAAQRRGVRLAVRRVENILAPGQTPQHYQPRLPLLIVAAQRLPLRAEDLLALQERWGLTGTRHEILPLNENPALAARELYAQLHELSSQDTDFLLVAWKEEYSSDLWEAVWDRLNRASSFSIGVDGSERKEEKN
jgi:L-threonylcarbamoyladenylate synthase